MKNNFINEIKPYLPIGIFELLSEKSESFLDEISEIRVSIDKPILLNRCGKIEFLKKRNEKVITDRVELQKIVDSVTNGSMYSVNESIKNGFVTVNGGHRIGFCGTAVCDENGIKHIKYISSVCIRISREVLGCALCLADELYENGSVSDILIASPPGCGKTTLLRDVSRLLGSGFINGVCERVGIADERNEISATFMGKAQKDIGVASFVCDGYNKASAIKMMLRSMSPSVVVTDEIGSVEDFEAIQMAKNSGVSVIVTAHAHSLEDLCFKYKKEILVQCFEKIIILENRGKVNKIYRRKNNDY